MNNFLKRCASVSVILIIMFGTFFFSYIAVPDLVYAADSQQEYVNVDNEEDALAGVIAYLNYRGLGFLSDNINSVRALLSDSQVELSEFYDTMKKTPAGILRFTYTAQGILKLNTIAQKYIDKYGLLNYNADSDSVTNNVYSGTMVSDPNGVKALCYIVDANSSTPNFVRFANLVVVVGSSYKYNLSHFTGNSGNLTCGFPVADPTQISSYSINQYSWEGGNYGYSLGSSFQDYLFKETSGALTFINNQGYAVIKTADNNYYVGSIAQQSNGYYANRWVIHATKITDGLSADNTTIDIYTPKGVNPAPEPDEPITPKDSEGNTYNYDNSTTYIDNSVHNNTTYYPSDDDDPNNPDNPDNPDNPSGPGITDPDNWSPSTWEVPDFSNFNFALPATLQNKWPWCIPWDLLTIMTIFVDDPETPEIKGPIHFAYGNVFSYTWNVNYDFHQFDDLAAKVRSVFKLIWLIGLSILTAILFNPN